MVASGIPPTKNLGKYLGIPSIHGRMNPNPYQPLIEKVATRLTSWKTKYLSSAERITLAQSVRNSIPLYTMQSALLPLGMLSAIDKKVRQYIWGSSEDRKGISLVSWKEITRSKEHEGLGIKQMHCMNVALMAKLGWRLLMERDNLRNKVITSKYIRGEVEQAKLMKKNNFSNIWKA